MFDNPNFRFTLLYCFTEVTSLLLLQQCIIFVPVIYLFVLQQSNIPLWASLQFHQIFILTTHRLCGHSPPHLWLPGSSSRGCQWQTWSLYQTCRWSGYVCWLQSLPALRSLMSLSGCSHLVERKNKTGPELSKSLPRTAHIPCRFRLSAVTAWLQRACAWTSTDRTTEGERETFPMAVMMEHWQTYF